MANTGKASACVLINSIFQMPHMQRVCVIGAGVAGLCAARHLQSRSDEFDIVVYEQGPVIGGLWNYANESPLDANGNPVHSACYMGLKYVMMN